MEMRAETRSDCAHLDRRAWNPPVTRALHKAWLQRYANVTVRATPDGGSENEVNQVRRAVRHERIKVRVEIHPFSFTLLLVNVRNPDQRCTPPRECLTYLWHKKVRNEARIKTSGPKNKEISLADRIQRTCRGFYDSNLQRYRSNASRSRKCRLTKDADTPVRTTT
jgi:hypothetical protein